MHSLTSVTLSLSDSFESRLVRSQASIGINAVTAYYGTSCWTFRLPGGFTAGQMFEATFYICALVTNLPVVLWNIYKSYRDRTGKMRSFAEAMRPMVAVIVFMIISTVWVVTSPANIVDLDPRAVYFVTGTIFSNICVSSAREPPFSCIPILALVAKK